jgi:integrase
MEASQWTALYDYCEQEGITYTVGLITNPRLKELSCDLLAEAQESYDRKGEKVRLFSEGLYRAASWEHERRVIYKAEAMEKGTNTRFLVSTRRADPKELYEFYARRGESENWIKDLKLALKADRLSCHRFIANQFRRLILATQRGTLVNPTNLRKRSFAPLLEKAGLLPIRFHELRHTCATLLLSRNVNPKIVSEMLGHATIAITLDTYSHVLPTMQDSATRALEDTLR